MCPKSEVITSPLAMCYFQVMTMFLYNYLPHMIHDNTKFRFILALLHWKVLFIMNRQLSHLNCEESHKFSFCLLTPQLIKKEMGSCPHVNQPPGCMGMKDSVHCAFQQSTVQIHTFTSVGQTPVNYVCKYKQSANFWKKITSKIPVDLMSCILRCTTQHETKTVHGNFLSWGNLSPSPKYAICTKPA